MLTPHLWEDVQYNTFGDVEPLFDTFGDVTGTEMELLAPAALESSIVIGEGDQQSFVDSESLLAITEDEQPFVDVFEVFFNDDPNNPGYRIEIVGLQSASVDFDIIDVIRRDPTGRYADELVRGLANVLVSRDAMTVIDYEAPIETPVEYYLRLHSDTGQFDFGPRQDSFGFIPTQRSAYGGGSAYLKSIDQPDLSIPLMVQNLSSWTQEARVNATFDVLGRRNPVVVTDVTSGRRGTLSAYVMTDQGLSLEEVESLVAPGTTLLLQNNNSDISGFPDLYLKVEQVRFSRKSMMVRDGRTKNVPPVDVLVVFEIDYIEVDRPSPVGIVAPLLEWSIVNDTHDNWQHVNSRYTSWRQVLRNPFGPNESS